MATLVSQDKTKEKSFFTQHASGDEYNVFSDASNERIVDACIRLSGITAGMKVADLGCGSGVFTAILQRRGLECFGLDLCESLLMRGAEYRPYLRYCAGDVESLPIATASLDAVFLSGILHHLPNLSACASEVKRVLRPGGRFVAFDPNLRNPFMWLYRAKASPFYSSAGVTENEQPLLAETVTQTFEEAGFDTGAGYLSGIAYRYIASPKLRPLLGIYNVLDHVLFNASFLKRHSAFVITYGVSR